MGRSRPEIYGIWQETLKVDGQFFCSICRGRKSVFMQEYRPAPLRSPVVAGTTFVSVFRQLIIKNNRHRRWALFLKLIAKHVREIAENTETVFICLLLALSASAKRAFPVAQDLHLIARYAISCLPLTWGAKRSWSTISINSSMTSSRMLLCKKCLVHRWPRSPVS